MNSPPNLTPEENEKRVAELRKRLEKVYETRKLTAWYNFILTALIIAYFFITSFFVTTYIFRKISLVIMLCLIFHKPVFNPRLRKKINLETERYWQKAFEDNVQLPLDLLIEACRTLKGDLQRTAENRLIAALDSPQAEEYLQLSERDRRGLFALAKIWYDEFDLAFLKMGEQYGGAEMIPPVRSILTFYRETTQVGAKFRRREEVRIAAERCLLVLEARVEAAKRGETLLRPSVPPVAPDLYLRPSQETPNAEDEKQLLRASVGEPEE